MIPDGAHLLVFVGASLLLLVTPGPAVLYIVTRSLEQGSGAGLISVLGLAVGGLVHVTAVVLGGAAVVATSAIAFGLMKYLGAGYLVYLGLRQWSRSREGPPASRPTRARTRDVFVQGVLVSLLNPKSAIFFLAFLPQFADAERGPVAGQLLLLGLVFLALALVTDSTYALLAGSVGARFTRSPWLGRITRYLSGGVYVGLGVATAVATRGV